MNNVNIREKPDLIQDFWNPRIAGELNGQMVKLVKFKGEFVWHNHDDGPWTLIYSHSAYIQK